MRAACMLLFTVSATVFSSCYMARAYKFRNLHLKSHEEMPSAPIAKADTCFLFKENEMQDASMKQKLDIELEGTGTAAFLVIRNDSILYENYFNGFSKSSLLPSFSVSKSFVATLIGVALEEGKIKSLNEPFTHYLPRFLKKDARFAEITLQHLLDMRSGLQWNEGTYGLKDDAIKMAFRPNIYPYVYKVKIKEAPGKMEYQSINTLLLAMVLEQATGVTPAQYLQEKIWKPLGMEFPATWSSDKHHHEMAYAGINAAARDYAKFGRLYLEKGAWNGKKILSMEWVNSSTSAAAMSGSNGYKNQFWGSNGYTEFTDSMASIKAAATIPYSSKQVHSYTTKEGARKFYIAYTGNAFYALGILGQYVYVNPDNHSIVVRLGYNWKHPRMQLERFVSSVSSEL